MSDCSFSDRLRERVVTTESWLKTHREHLEWVDGFGHESFLHPSGKWGFVMCSCGAKLLVTDIHETIKEIGGV